MSSKVYHIKSTDTQDYSSGYEVFLRRTNFRDKVLEHFEGSLPPEFKTKKIIRVLDIGCGNGKMTKLYLDSLSHFVGGSDLEVHLLEPAAEALSKAKEEVSSVAKRIVEINQTADEYFSTTKNESFDLVIASYVFYHISENVFPNIIRTLSKDGVISIMMGAKEHPLRNHPDLRSISKHGDSESLKEILGGLIERGAVTSNLISIKTDLDLNGLWNDGILSEDGKKFFSFMYNVNMAEFPQVSGIVLNSILAEAYNNNEGVVHPVHEIIWVKKA